LVILILAVCFGGRYIPAAVQKELSGNGCPDV